LRLRELAPGKINLCLFLGPLRDDGRHELVTLYESVSLADELVISEAAGADEVVMVVAPWIEGPNLVGAALEGLRRRGWSAPLLRVAIEKRIPIAGGMGGGSADAAALLRAAPRIALVDASVVAELAAELGSDVPGQLQPGVSVGTGAGEIVSPRPPLAEHRVVIVPLEARLATPAVYAEADRLGLGRGRDDLAARLAEIEQALVAGARPPGSLLVNDLEPAAQSLCPQIEEALQAVRDAGVDQAMVCGSGPTVAGLCWGAEAAGRAEAAVARLRERFPRACAAAPVSSPS
jgi:4-diphosphocytidyl-2-C-methyl-D-erythritol kinase